MGQILLASEKPHERPALSGDLIADGPAQHRVAVLQRVENRALRHRTFNLESHFPFNARQCPQMRREDHSDHDSV